jgi:AraC family transcriptional activator of pobA
VAHDQTIPAYSLFGQAAELVEPRFCHVERIGDRWRLHAGQVEEHAHPHLHQITLWVAGRGLYIADDHKKEIAPGTVCWMPAGTVHGFRAEPGSEAIVLSMSEDFAREQLGGLAGMVGLRPLRSSLIAQTAEDVGDWQRALFLRMEHEYRAGGPGQVEAIGALARLALTEMLRQDRRESAESQGGGVEPPLLVRFMALVEARFGERPGIDALAGELGTTPYLLNRACRTGLGLRASEVVRRRQVQEAKRLLLFTALGIGEVAEMLGHADPAHFARSFRAMTGQSPRAWREQRIGGGT